MTFLKEGPEGVASRSYGAGKTNWAYIAIVVILAIVVGGGILVWIKMQEVSLVEFAEITKPEKIVDETANWKIYQNYLIGFSVKYPSEWEIFLWEESEEKFELEIENKEGSCRVVFGKAKEEGLTFVEVVAEIKKFFLEDPKVREITEENILLDEVSAVKLIYAMNIPTKRFSILVPVEDKVFFINFDRESAREECEITFNQMLSTFRFLE